jgi:hypothetical protein
MPAAHADALWLLLTVHLLPPAPVLLIVHLLIALQLLLTTQSAADRPAAGVCCIWW